MKQLGNRGTQTYGVDDPVGPVRPDDRRSKPFEVVPFFDPWDNRAVQKPSGKKASFNSAPPGTSPEQKS